MKRQIIINAMQNERTFVPLHMRDGYKLYMTDDIKTGSFGMAIIEQDAEKARARADFINSNHIESQILWWKEYGSKWS